MLITSWSARTTPFNQREGTQVFIVSLMTNIVFVATIVSNVYIKKSNHSDAIIGIAMTIHAYIVLLGLFIPLLYAIHKYGAAYPKTGSYADSLSTIFTSFGANRDYDNLSHNSIDSRKSDRRRLKSAKLSDYNQTANFFARVSPNHFSFPCDHNVDASLQTRASLINNPLYEGVPGFRSAYP